MLTQSLCYIIQKTNVEPQQIDFMFHEQPVRVDGKTRYCAVFNATLYPNAKIYARAIYNGQIYRVVWEEYENLSVWTNIEKPKQPKGE